MSTSAIRQSPCRISPRSPSEVSVAQSSHNPADLPLSTELSPSLPAVTRPYMTDDQRFASSRPDVMVYETAVLEEDLTLVGPFTASLRVSTTGTDSDVRY